MNPSHFLSTHGADLLKKKKDPVTRNTLRRGTDARCSLPILLDETRRRPRTRRAKGCDQHRHATKNHPMPNTTCKGLRNGLGTPLAGAPKCGDSPSVRSEPDMVQLPFSMPAESPDRYGRWQKAATIETAPASIIFAKTRISTSFGAPNPYPLLVWTQQGILQAFSVTLLLCTVEGHNFPDPGRMGICVRCPNGAGASTLSSGAAANLFSPGPNRASRGDRDPRGWHDSRRKALWKIEESWDDRA